MIPHKPFKLIPNRHNLCHEISAASSFHISPKNEMSQQSIFNFFWLQFRIPICERFFRKEAREDHHRLHLGQSSIIGIQRWNRNRLEPQRSCLGWRWPGLQCLWQLSSTKLPDFASKCLKQVEQKWSRRYLFKLLNVQRREINFRIHWEIITRKKSFAFDSSSGAFNLFPYFSFQSSPVDAHWALMKKKECPKSP